MDSTDGNWRIHRNWGFGMAPVKPDTQRSRVAAARRVRAALDELPSLDPALLEDISTVKGLFTRSLKRDQWDWFTVWSQLGFPAHQVLGRVSEGFAHLRRALKTSNVTAAQVAVADLAVLGVPTVLGMFVSGTVVRPERHGFVYVLSVREFPDWLKIGYTERDIATRVKEINRATGVMIPLGARGAWMVPHARAVESDLHAMFKQYRVRADREFFRLPFPDAVKRIDAYVEAMSPSP